MATFKINGITLDIDVKYEMEKYQWDSPKWSEDKLIACSPFREERKPSFFINFIGQYAGRWGDSGAVDLEWEGGGLVKLLGFLLKLTEDEVNEYLIEEYAPIDYQWEEKKPLSIALPSKEGIVYPERSLYREYLYRSNYLDNRGVTEEVQRQCRIGFDRKSQAVAIPWFTGDDTFANVKFRSIKSKVFWYLKGGAKITNLVYNINLAYKNEWDYAVLCEAEIDAMTWMSVGVPAIATGGAHMSDKQYEIILKSPLKKLYICPDQDEAGIKFLKKVVKPLLPFKKIAIIELPKPFKDSNEAHVAGIALDKLGIRDITNTLKIF